MSKTFTIVRYADSKTGQSKLFDSLVKNNFINDALSKGKLNFCDFRELPIRLEGNYIILIDRKCTSRSPEVIEKDIETIRSGVNDPNTVRVVTFHGGYSENIKLVENESNFLNILFYYKGSKKEVKEVLDKKVNAITKLIKDLEKSPRTYKNIKDYLFDIGYISSNELTYLCTYLSNNSKVYTHIPENEFKVFKEFANFHRSTLRSKLDRDPLDTINLVVGGRDALNYNALEVFNKFFFKQEETKEFKEESLEEAQNTIEQPEPPQVVEHRFEAPVEDTIPLTDEELTKLFRIYEKVKGRPLLTKSSLFWYYGNLSTDLRESIASNVGTAKPDMLKELILLLAEVEAEIEAKDKENV